jgi:hypothetical protein
VAWRSWLTAVQLKFFNAWRLGMLNDTSTMFDRDEHVGISRKTEVQGEIGAKDLRQQENGIKRDGQTSPARDHCRVVG